MKGEVKANGEGKITSVEWSACENSIGCSTTTAKALALPWTANVVTGGAMTVKNPKGEFNLGQGGFCFQPEKCVYSVAEVHPKFINHSGTTAAQIKAEKLPLELVVAESTGGCSKTATWTATYNLASGEGANTSVH
jgi:hypothetical protein